MRLAQVGILWLIVCGIGGRALFMPSVVEGRLIVVGALELLLDLT
ncbi:hypothetical protein [Gaiella sp.]